MVLNNDQQLCSNPPNGSSQICKGKPTVINRNRGLAMRRARCFQPGLASRSFLFLVAAVVLFDAIELPNRGKCKPPSG